MSTFKQLNYLLDRKMKGKLVLLFFMILLGSAAELLGITIILPIIELAMDTGDFTEPLLPDCYGHHLRHHEGTGASVAHRCDGCHLHREKCVYLPHVQGAVPLRCGYANAFCDKAYDRLSEAAVFLFSWGQFCRSDA